MSHVMLNTITRSHYLGSKPSNVTCSTSATAKTATTTQPVTGSGSIVVGGVFNYMKIHPWADSSTPTIRVIGWSFCPDTKYFVPHSIAEVQMASLTGTNVSVLGSNLQAAATLTKSAGDAKLFAPSSTATDAYFVIDGQGFQYIELHFRVASGTVLANAHIGEM